jgi:hypothetical protein
LERNFEARYDTMKIGIRFDKRLGDYGIVWGPL